MKADFKKMRHECLQIRNEIVDAIHAAGSGHCGGSLSSVEILWTLYSQILRIDPSHPALPQRDRFVLSKGHAAPALYTVLARKGFFDTALLQTLRKTGSSLQGHPDMLKTPGVDMSSGSLGMGISVGVGMSLSARLLKSDYKTYVLVGDGELQEGQNWEAMAAANKFALSNLIVVVDKNGVQLDGTTQAIMPMLDIAEKIESFGFEVLQCNGHDCESIYKGLHSFSADHSKPKALVADTVKGKGVSFMEGRHEWHGKTISAPDYELARKDLSEAETACTKEYV